MGTILHTRKKGKKVVAEILSDYDEYLQLKGHLENIRLFSENLSTIQTNISQRGKNSATKYFLIPCHLRRGLFFNAPTSCQKLELEDKFVFIYVVNKQQNTLNNSHPLTK